MHAHYNGYVGPMMAQLVEILRAARVVSYILTGVTQARVGLNYECIHMYALD